MADSRGERKRLNDIVIHARRAREVAEALGFSREQFEVSLTYRLAIIWCIAVIGEAASKLSQDTKDALPHIVWHEMIGMRNHLIHGYFRINRDIVWNAVIHNLPPLIEAMEPQD